MRLQSSLFWLTPKSSSDVAYISCSAHETWDSLSSVGELVRPASDNRTDFIKECRDGKLDGVVAAYRTFMSASITGLIDEELVEALPKSMRFLAHCGMRTNSAY